MDMRCSFLVNISHYRACIFKTYTPCKMYR
nr:MAG TPA: hypothetical protein [Caudoviricetes sp.]